MRLGIVKTVVPIGIPFSVENRGGILPLEVCSHDLLERSHPQEQATTLGRLREKVIENASILCSGDVFHLARNTPTLLS